MRNLWRSAIALTLVTALASCAGGPSFGELFDDSAAGEGTGLQASSLVRAVVILARHQATAQQRQAAEQNARRAVAQLQARAEAEPKPTAGARQKPQRPRKAKVPRVIAVATTKDERTDKKAAKAIMLFDTHANQIIGNDVYDIETEPKRGEEVRFETHAASYIGASL